VFFSFRTPDDGQTPKTRKSQETEQLILFKRTLTKGKVCPCALDEHHIMNTYRGVQEFEMSGQLHSLAALKQGKHLHTASIFRVS
jgi:hypothetical protein